MRISGDDDLRRLQNLDTDMDWLKTLLEGNTRATRCDDLVRQTRSRNGFERQAAVRALASSRHAAALPALIERLNDWVDAVRHDARLAVQAFLRDEFTADWMASLEALAALMRRGRVDHTAMIECIGAFLLEPGRRAVLRSTTVPREVDRLLLDLQLRDAASLDRPRALREALVSHDIVLAGMAATAMLAPDADQADLADLARLACGARFTSVRVAGLRAALALGGGFAAERARAMALDGNATARSLAIAALRDDHGARTELLDRARATLSGHGNTRRRIVALDALCTLDEALGLASCRSLQHDASAALRVAALRRLFARATPQARDALVLQALGDLSSKVRRLAVAQVRRGANPPSIDALDSLCATRPAAWASVLAVGERLSPWTRLALSLALLQTLARDTQAVDRLQRDIASFTCHRGFPPYANETDAVRRAWAGGRDLLPIDLHRQASAFLRDAGVLVA